MEKEGLARAISFLSEKKLSIGVLVTDRHRQINGSEKPIPVQNSTMMYGMLKVYYLFRLCLIQSHCNSFRRISCYWGGKVIVTKFTL